MISSLVGATDTYVYLTLPGETAPVTAGRFVLETDRRGLDTGRFVYGRRYLERSEAVEIDPVELRLVAGPFETLRLRGVFGALRDAGPDHWGRRVIERQAGTASLGEIDYLLHSPDDRAGALGFGRSPVPPAPMRRYNQTLDLRHLQEIAERLLRDDQPDTRSAAGAASPTVLQAEDLLRLGTSMGGARPKAVVEDEQGLWLAKFNLPDDRWNAARVECAMLRLGRECGLDTAQARVETLGDRDVLLVRRFDRERSDAGYRRARMVSALTLLRADDSVQARDRWSYVLLVEELRRASVRPREDAVELFRRMAFNALISNTDDHPRNHALIAPGAAWRLAPAYDLTPTSPVALDRRDLAMACGDQGRRASAANLESQAARFLLATDEAAQILAGMESTIRARWLPVCRACGVTAVDCERIAGAFAYPGFRASSFNS